MCPNFSSQGTAGQVFEDSSVKIDIISLLEGKE